VALTDIRLIKQAGSAIKKAFSNQLEGKGFSLVEVLSTCPTNWNMEPLEAVRWVEEEMTGHFPLGIFKDIDGGGID
jgi:2-oxoglutarate ferredoxin oxidoreductase subunit beta